MDQTEAIKETRHKIESDICRRRTILDALDFVTRSNFLIHMAKWREDLEGIMSDKTLLAYDLLRDAPVHLREMSLPITQLEDVIALFDTVRAPGCYLAQAMMLYQMEACQAMMPARRTTAKDFDQSFAPAYVQEAVKSIYKLDEYLSTSSEDDTDSILPQVLNLLTKSNSYLVRPVTLLKSLASKSRHSAALLVASDAQALAANRDNHNQLEEFMRVSVEVFLALGKVNEAFGLLA